MPKTIWEQFNTEDYTQNDDPKNVEIEPHVATTKKPDATLEELTTDAVVKQIIKNKRVATNAEKEYQG